MRLTVLRSETVIRSKSSVPREDEKPTIALMRFGTCWAAASGRRGEGTDRRGSLVAARAPLVLRDDTSLSICRANVSCSGGAACACCGNRRNVGEDLTATL